MSQDTLPENEEFTEEELLEYKKELKKYYLTCLWMEGSKILLFVLIFGYLDLMKEFWMALFALMLLRNNGGGIHCKHYISCFAVSFLVLGAGIILPHYIRMPVMIMVPLLVICAFLGYRLVPIVSENRPEPSPEIILRSKRITFLIILIYTILICMRPDNPYLHIGIWTIFIHIIQLLMAKIRKGGREG